MPKILSNQNLKVILISSSIFLNCNTTTKVQKSVPELASFETGMVNNSKSVIDNIFEDKFKIWEKDSFNYLYGKYIDDNPLFDSLYYSFAEDSLFFAFGSSFNEKLSPNEGFKNHITEYAFSFINYNLELDGMDTLEKKGQFKIDFNYEYWVSYSNCIYDYGKRFNLIQYHIDKFIIEFSLIKGNLTGIDTIR